ncbi:autophagy-related protein 13-domain-containing protein [Globomyces pollinis-pini]|nr:autophagy-related protein 13-domain-containing protein [Globomyces pollinis-pini]
MLKNNSTGRTHRIRSEDLQGVDSTGRSIRKKHILLETWQLTFSPDIPHDTPELPVVYKKSIVFFRTLYSFVRLMPSYRICRNSARQKNSCKIIYRLGSSRVHSPFDAGLDQLLPSTDMRLGLSETAFESVETPLGVFHLHTTYRIECDFAVDDSEVALDRFADVEPNFFSLQQVSKRNSQNSISNSSDNDSATKMHRQLSHTDSLKRPGSSYKREGVRIPFSKISSPNPMKSNSINSSPETQFRVGTAPHKSMLHSLQSPHFVPFTPPHTDFTPPFANNWTLGYSDQPPPFSTASMSQSDANKFVIEKPDFLSSSPPFAIHKQESDDPSKSLSIVRRPSYIFPSSPNTVSSTPLHNTPLLFTPTSSFAHSSVMKQLNSHSNPIIVQKPPEIEQFLSTIEQIQPLKITSGESVKQSLLTGSRVESSQTIMSTLDRFKALKTSNDAFTKQIDLQQINELQESKSSPMKESPGLITPDLDPPFLREIVKFEPPSAHPTTNFQGQFSTNLNTQLTPFNMNQPDFANASMPFPNQTWQPPTVERMNQSNILQSDKRNRQRSATSEWISSKDPIDRYDGLSRSEYSLRQPSHDEDDLLFNMSELDV